MISGITVPDGDRQGNRQEGHGRHRAQGGPPPADRHHRSEDQGSARQLLDPGRRPPVREGRREGRRRHAAGQDAAQGGPAPRTSPAVCRGWPSCSRPAARRTPARSPRSTARSRFGANVRGKTQRHRHRSRDRRGGRAPRPDGQAHHRHRGRPREARRPDHRRPGGSRGPARSLRRRRSSRSTWSTRCRRSTACRAWRSTTSTSRSSSARCCAR